jgi:hypothetical protein
MALSLPVPLVGAQGTPSSDACALLSDPETMQMISGPGQTALQVQCGVSNPTTGADVLPNLATSDDDLSIATITPGNVLVNDRTTDVYPQITESETSVAVSGTTVLVGFNDSGGFLPGRTTFTGYSRSTDGGATFTDLGSPTVPLNNIASISGDPVVVAARTGTTFFANLANLVTPASRSAIGVHRTVDGGSTWAGAANAAPLAGSGEFQDKEWLATDNRASGAGAGNIYVCWRRFGGAGGVQFSRSVDGGLTFTQLATNLSSRAANVTGCQVAVDQTNGNVYVAWVDTGFAPPQMRARTSTDGGITFSAEVLIGNADTAENNTAACGRPAFVDSEPGFASRAIRSTSFPSLAVNPLNGDVYAVWHRANLAGGSSADIAFSRSTKWWSHLGRCYARQLGCQRPAVLPRYLGERPWPDRDRLLFDPELGHRPPAGLL